MALASYIVRKRGRYHVRCRVPRDLVNILGRQEIRRALGTASPDEARRLAPLAVAALMETFGRLRVDEDEDGKLVAEAKRALADVGKGIIETQAKVIAAHESMADGRETLDALQEKHRLEAAGREQDLIRGIGVLASRGAPVPAPDPFEGLHEDARKPLHELLDAFLEHRPQTERRRNEYLNELDRWKRSVGDKPVAEIRRRDVDKYHDLILTEIKPRKGAKVVPWDTQNKALSCIRTLLQWACDTERRPETNPAARVRPKGVSKAEKNRPKRRPFKREELERIFSAPLYVGSATKSGYKGFGDVDMSDDGRYWIGLVALMTGARLGELLALRTGDVVPVGETTYLNVTTEVGDEDDEEGRRHRIAGAERAHRQGDRVALRRGDHAQGDRIMRNRVLRVRMSDEELEAIRLRAEEERLAVSSFLRCAALGRSRRTERRLPHPQAPDLLSLHRELRRVGVNLNQLAKRANSGGGTSGLAEVMADVERAAEAVRGALS